MYQNNNQYSSRGRGWGPRQNFPRGRGNPKHFRGNQFKQFNPRFQHYSHFNPNNQYDRSSVNMRYQPYSAKNHHYQEYGSGDHVKYGSCFSKSSQGKTQGINKVQVEGETPEKISLTTTTKENKQTESVLERKHWKPSDDFAVKPKKSEKLAEKRQWRPADDFNQPPKTKLDDLRQLSKKTTVTTNTVSNGSKKTDQLNTNMSNSNYDAYDKAEEQFYFKGKKLTIDNFLQVMGSKKLLTERQKWIRKIYVDRLKAKQRKDGTTPPRLCGLCGKVFPRMKELVSHLKKDEIKSNLFTCPVCNKWRQSVNKADITRSVCYRINKHVIKCRHNSKGYHKMVDINIEGLDVYYDTDTDNDDSDDDED